MKNVKKGTRFIITKDFPTHALTSWGKPYTGSEGCVIPKNTIADHDQRPGATDFGAVPVKYEEMEKQLISEKTLADKDYGGYYFVLLNDDYGKQYVCFNENDGVATNSDDEINIPEKYTLSVGRREKVIDNPSSDDIREGVLYLNVHLSANFFHLNHSTSSS